MSVRIKRQIVARTIQLIFIPPLQIKSFSHINGRSAVLNHKLNSAAIYDIRLCMFLHELVSLPPSILGYNWRACTNCFCLFSGYSTVSSLISSLVLPILCVYDVIGLHLVLLSHLSPLLVELLRFVLSLNTVILLLHSPQRYFSASLRTFRTFDFCGGNSTTKSIQKRNVVSVEETLQKYVKIFPGFYQSIFYCQTQAVTTIFEDNDCGISLWWFRIFFTKCEFSQKMRFFRKWKQIFEIFHWENLEHCMEIVFSNFHIVMTFS